MPIERNYTNVSDNVNIKINRTTKTRDAPRSITDRWNDDATIEKTVSKRRLSKKRNVTEKN